MDAGTKIAIDDQLSTLLESFSALQYQHAGALERVEGDYARLIEILCSLPQNDDSLTMICRTIGFELSEIDATGLYVHEEHGPDWVRVFRHLVNGW